MATIFIVFGTDSRPKTLCTQNSLLAIQFVPGGNADEQES
jgi:hypothetical protein